MVGINKHRKAPVWLSMSLISTCVCSCNMSCAMWPSKFLTLIFTPQFSDTLTACILWWYKITNTLGFLFGSGSPPVFISPVSSCFQIDEWHLAHQPSKGKKKAHLFLSICALLSLFFFYLFLELPILLWSFLGYRPPQSPFSHFPFLFLLFCPSLSLFLKSLFRFLFMLLQGWRFKDWGGFQNSQISQFLKLNIILKLEK